MSKLISIIFCTLFLAAIAVQVFGIPEPVDHNSEHSQHGGGGHGQHGGGGHGQHGGGGHGQHGGGGHAQHGGPQHHG